MMSSDDRPIINGNGGLTQEVDEEITFRFPATGPFTSHSAMDCSLSNSLNNNIQSNTQTNVEVDDDVNTSSQFQTPQEQDDRSQSDIGKVVSNMAGILKDVVKELQILKQPTECSQAYSSQNLNAPFRSGDESYQQYPPSALPASGDRHFNRGTNIGRQTYTPYGDHAYSNISHSNNRILPYQDVDVNYVPYNVSPHDRLPEGPTQYFQNNDNSSASYPSFPRFPQSFRPAQGTAKIPSFSGKED